MDPEVVKQLILIIGEDDVKIDNVDTFIECIDLVCFGYADVHESDENILYFRLNDVGLPVYKALAYLR